VIWGVRAGKFLVLLEIESLEARDRYFPNPGEESEESTRFFEQHPEAAAAWEKWQKLGPFGSKTDVSTDYVAVAEYYVLSERGPPAERFDERLSMAKWTTTRRRAIVATLYMPSPEV
jgi:hypothetical protein